MASRSWSWDCCLLCFEYFWLIVTLVELEKHKLHGDSKHTGRLFLETAVERNANHYVVFARPIALPLFLLHLCFKTRSNHFIRDGKTAETDDSKIRASLLGTLRGTQGIKTINCKCMPVATSLELSIAPASVSNQSR
jgi:hypothetical protein